MHSQPSPDSPKRRRGSWPLSLLPLLICFASACAPAEPEPLPPNVVLLVLDTVRADHISSYGYERDTTPHVDALAEQATRYTQCRSTGPWTLPSHASMFTGRFAFQHRADSLLNDEGQWRELPLKFEHTTLAEALRDVGYRTAGFVANAAYLREVFQLNQGFEHYVVQAESGVEKNATAFEWVEQTREPFFLFLNYMDAHRPYNTQALENGRLAEFPCSASTASSKLLDRMYDVVMRDGEETPPALLKEVTACYDLGVANADLAVGGVIAELKRRGLWDNTLLIVTSDHGEFLGEHALVEHSKDIYEEVLHVPLVVKSPGQTASREEHGLISLADLPALVLAALPQDLQDELAAPFPLPLERDFSIAEVSISRERDMRASYGARFRRQRQVLYARGHKLILSSDGQNELYDLEQDPGEEHNVYGDGPLTAELTRELETFIRDHPADYQAAESPEFDAEAMRVLEELGYAGNGSPDDKDDQ